MLGEIWRRLWVGELDRTDDIVVKVDQFMDALGDEDVRASVESVREETTGDARAWAPLSRNVLCEPKSSCCAAAASLERETGLLVSVEATALPSLPVVALPCD